MKIKQTTRTISLDELATLESVDSGTGTAEHDAPNSREEERERIKEDRYYLPVLHLNHKEEWASQPLSERKHLTPELAEKTCLGNCCGFEGLKGACCLVDPEHLEHVLGPIDEDWIEETIRWFRVKKGTHVTRADLVIDFEEGKRMGRTLFQGSENKSIFEQKTAYPILRMQVIGPRFGCKFLNPETFKCGIYEQRPSMCRDYYCQHIVTNFMVKLKAHPNWYVKAR
jgi:hypothetical protein